MSARKPARRQKAAEASNVVPFRPKVPPPPCAPVPTTREEKLQAAVNLVKVLKTTISMIEDILAQAAAS